MKFNTMKIIYETVHGSHLYGTSLPTSDKDSRGVCLQPVRSLLGLIGFEQQEQKTPDRVIYGVNKFFQLAKDCNPNIVEILFAPLPGIVCTKEWYMVQEIRDAFISRKAKHTFTGYAFAQFKRMKTHHDYLTGSIPKDVQPEDFGGYKDDKGNIKWPSNVYQNEYHNAHNKYVNYRTWIENRNPVRAELEAKYLYDTKYGMHLVRLITEGVELLETGKITLPRPDAKWLLEIRNGLFTYEQMEQYVNDGEKLMEEIEKNSKLPFSADFETIEEMLIKINLLTIKEWE